MKIQYETIGGTIRKTREVKKGVLSANKTYITYESVDGKLLFERRVFQGFHYASDRMRDGVLTSNSRGKFTQLGVNAIETK